MCTREFFQEFLPSLKVVFAFFCLVGCASSVEPPEPTSASAVTGAESVDQPPHIFLIVVDGLRTDRAGFGGNERNTTPNLDHFASQSVIFDNSFSQSNESLLSHASMFTGEYPSEIAHPNYLTYVIPDSATVLAEAMAAVGYDTAAFVAGGHVKGLFGFLQGFNVFEESRDFGTFFDTVPLAFDWLDRRKASDGPIFMMLHGYDLHRPYGKASVFFHPFGDLYPSWVDSRITRRSFTERIYKKTFYQNFRHPRTKHGSGERILNPTSYRTMAEWVETATPEELDRSKSLSDEDIKDLRIHYDASVLMADTYVGLFLDDLERRGLMQDAVVIITSDHGEGLQEHNLCNHRMGLYDTTTKVPMIIGGGAIPDAWRGTRNPNLIAAIDVPNTVTEIAGTVPLAGSHGRSLWAMLKGENFDELEAVYQEGVIGHIALRTAKWRLVFDGLDLPRPELDDELASLPIESERFMLFDSVNDPMEQNNLTGSETEQAERLREALVRLRSQLKKGDAKMELSPEIKKMLQDKGGYF